MATTPGIPPHLSPRRDCGSCTLCCKLVGVEELGKGRNAWCPHCEKGRGCRIYETRPATCRTFHCLWLVDQGIEECLKPERSKVVLVGSREKGEVAAFVDPAYPDAWRRDPMHWLLNRMAERFQVTILIGERRIDLPRAVAGTVRAP
jgi:hypothetical protein